MAEVELKINAEAINEQIVKAITESVLGEQLRREVERQVRGLHDHGGPVRAAVAGILRQHATDLIIREYGEKIKEKVAERLTDEAINDMVDRLWRNVLS